MGLPGHIRAGFLWLTDQIFFYFVPSFKKKNFFFSSNDFVRCFFNLEERVAEQFQVGDMSKACLNNITWLGAV
jgi:hypothetical protein